MTRQISERIPVESLKNSWEESLNDSLNECGRYLGEINGEIPERIKEGILACNPEFRKKYRMENGFSLHEEFLRNS